MKIPAAQRKLNLGPILPRTECGLCDLLARFGAVYSITDPIYRMALLTGTYQPVKCGPCGKWFLICSESERNLS